MVIALEICPIYSTVPQGQMMCLQQCLSRLSFSSQSVAGFLNLRKPRCHSTWLRTNGWKVRLEAKWPWEPCKSVTHVGSWSFWIPSNWQATLMWAKWGFHPILWLKHVGWNPTSVAQNKHLLISTYSSLIEPCCSLIKHINVLQMSPLVTIVKHDLLPPLDPQTAVGPGRIRHRRRGSDLPTSSDDLTCLLYWDSCFMLFLLLKPVCSPSLRFFGPQVRKKTAARCGRSMSPDHRKWKRRGLLYPSLCIASRLLNFSLLQNRPAQGHCEMSKVFINQHSFMNPKNT